MGERAWYGAIQWRIFRLLPPHKHDEPFVPYALAVVDMEAGIRLVGQMVDKPEEAKVGSQVELVIDAIYHEDGKAFTSWKFKQL